MAGAASLLIASRTDYWDERDYLQADPLATSQITPAPTLQYQVTAASRQIWWCEIEPVWHRFFGAFHAAFSHHQVDSR